MFETTLRYNGSSNKHAVEVENPLFDSVMISGKMLAYSKNALPESIRQLRTEQNVDYYVEPFLSDFRVGNDFRDEDGTLAGWHQRYVEEQGDPLQDHLESNSNANPRRMEEGKVREIARSSVRFQEDFVPNRVEEQTGKYEDVDTDGLRPKAVIPWHHRITNERDLGPNRTIIETTVEESTIPVKPCIHTTKSYISDATHRKGLVELAAAFDTQECFLLIEDLDKQDTYEDAYRDVIDLVYDISETGVDPHFFYGDFFSNLLSYFGLTGTAYGVMYGEDYSETTERTDQSGMLVRYYVDQIKNFLKVPAAVEFLQYIDAEMCECEVCKRHFDSWQDIADHHNSDEALMNHVQKHYVECRWNHAQYVENTPFEEARKELRASFNEYVKPHGRARQISPDKDLEYLRRWASVLESREELAEDPQLESVSNRVESN